MATELICPKCQGLMRTYERSGVTVDQCADCRGIFLDRGELEHQRYDPRHDDARRYGEGQQVRRKKSFFDELFD
jgi:Zn-finger nucleic acid-binding protein